jgi:uncharacterized iron-regulated membrane protein
MKKILRSIARGWHIWLGLAVGVPFCLMGLSGSLIVYRDAIETAARPHWMAAGKVRPPSMLAEVDSQMRRRWPNAVPNRITFPRSPSEPYQFLIHDAAKQVHAYFDSGTGEFLGTFELPWLDWIAGFHQNLRLPPSGRQMVGAIGIALFLSTLTGLATWFLHNPAWSNIFRVGWKAPWNRFSFDLHRATGLAANATLLTVSFTGICIGFPETFRSFSEVATWTQGARAAHVSVQPSKMKQPLAAYVQSAQAAVPGQVRELRFPTSPDRPVTVRIWRDGDNREEGSNQVHLDPATAQVVAVDTQVQWTAARKLASLPAPIHYAEWGGPLVKALWCLTGLAPTVLFVSGLSFWLAGYRARRRTSKRAEQARVLATR